MTQAPARTVGTTATPSHAARPERAEPLLRLLVGATFRRRREQQGRTLAAVAGDARVSIAYLSEIERGRKEPSSEVLLAVCHALGMRLADLLVEAAGELRAAELRRTRRTAPSAVRAPAARPARARPAAVPAGGEVAPAVVDVRSVTERAAPAQETARRALLSVA